MREVSSRRTSALQSHSNSFPSRVDAGADPPPSPTPQHNTALSPLPTTPLLPIQNSLTPTTEETSFPPSPTSSPSPTTTLSPLLIPTDQEWLSTLPPAKDPLWELYDVVSNLKADGFAYFIPRLPNFEESPFLTIPRDIKEGFDLGIRSRIEEIFIPENYEMPPAAILGIDRNIRRDLERGRLAGPYDPHFLYQEIGVPFRSNPIGAVEKDTPPGEPQKYRDINNLSFPHDSRQNLPNSINSELDPDFVPCKWTKLKTTKDWIRRLPPGAEVMVTDLSEAFRQLPLHPSQRLHHGIWWRGQFYWHKAPNFGGRTTPGVFGNVVDCTSAILENEIDGLLVLTIVDDLCFARTRPTITSHEIFNIIDERLGWIRSEEKTQPWSKRFKFGGVIFDLSLGTMELAKGKQEKYLRRLEGFLTQARSLLPDGSKAKVSKQQVMKILGTLYYITEIVPTRRPLYRHTLQLLRDFHDSSVFAERYVNRNVFDELSNWRRFLADTDVIRSSFLLPPSILPVTIFTDAEPRGLGVIINDCWATHFPLSPKWIDYASQPGNIAAPEAFAVEAAVQQLLSLGIVRSNGLSIGCDNKVVVDCWRKGRSNNKYVNDTIHRLLLLCEEHQVTLFLTYVHTGANPADAVSRGTIAPHLKPFPNSIAPPPGTVGSQDPY